MPKAAFCGLPHSESEVYYVKSSAAERSPPGRQGNRTQQRCRYRYFFGPNHEINAGRIIKSPTSADPIVMAPIVAKI